MISVTFVPFSRIALLQLELLLSFGWIVATLGAGAYAIDPRRGPHHPREEPLPPGVRPHHRGPSMEHNKLTHDTELIRDAAHIQEDIGRPLEGMSDEELEFHYFKLHDFDKNSLLDGLEMLKAIYHTLDHEHEEDNKEEGHTLMPSEEELNRYISLVDKVLEEDDLNNDGFLSYPEFTLGRSSGRSIDIVPKQSNNVN